MGRRKIPAKRPDGCITILEGAALLGVSRTTFFNYMEEDDFPQPVIKGGKGRPTWYRKTDIEEWKRRREEAAGQPPA